MTGQCPKLPFPALPQKDGTGCSLNQEGCSHQLRAGSGTAPSDCSGKDPVLLVSAGVTVFRGGGWSWAALGCRREQEQRTSRVWALVSACFFKCIYDIVILN